jgi:hypothetical protein
LDELVQEKKKANLEKVQKELLERQNEIDKYHKKLY